MQTTSGLTVNARLGEREYSTDSTAFYSPNPPDREANNQEVKTHALTNYLQNIACNCLYGNHLSKSCSDMDPKCALSGSRLVVRRT